MNEYSNYNLGIGIALASILILTVLAISNPVYFIISLVILFKYTE